MWFPTLLAALAPQASTSIPVPGERPPRQRPHITTLQGSLGAAQLGLLDLRTGDFVPERLSEGVRGLTVSSILRLEFVGRSEVTGSLPGAPRLRDDVGAGSRIELADGRGTLLKVAGLRAGQAVVAFLHVNRDGVPRVLLEVPTSTVALDPFTPRVGIAWDSSALLVATRPANGGDLFEVDLASGGVELRSAHAPPLDVAPDGLWLGDGFGFAVSPRGVHRFLRQAGAQVANVPVPGASPVVWRGDAAMSPRGTTAVAIAGHAPDGWIPYVFDGSGPARPAAPGGDRISAAGYLPDVLFGPFLAVTDDGVTAAWRVEIPPAGAFTGSTEAIIGRVDVATPPVMASGDSIILDTLDEVGRLVPGPAGDILFAVGEGNDPTEGGLESADVFSIDLDAAGALAMRNVSGTSGDLVFPFDTHVPTWTPARFALVDSATALVHDDDAKQLFALHLVTGQRTLILSAVRDVGWIEVSDASGAWCATVRRDGGSRPWQVIGAASPAGQVSILDPGGPMTQYLHPTSYRRRSDAFAAPPGAVAYLRRDAGAEFLDVVDLGSLQRRRWNLTAASFRPPLVFIGPRALVFSVSAGGALASQRIWSFRGSPVDCPLGGMPSPSRLFQ